MRCARPCWRRPGRAIAASEPVVLGILSLIIWALLLVVTAKYVLILLRADNKGEGGTLALMALASRALGAPRRHRDLSRCHQRCAVLWRRHHHAGAVGALGDRGLESRDARRSTHTWCRSPCRFWSCLFAVQSRGTARVAAFFGPVTLFWFAAIAAAGIWHVGTKSDGAAGVQSLVRREFPAPPRHHRILYARRRLPGRDRRGSALCRSRPFRPRADPDRLAGRRAAGAYCQLSRAGRAGAGRSEIGRKSVLPALSGLGAAADGGPGHRGDRDRQPGGDHRRLFAHPAGDPARTSAAP